MSNEAIIKELENLLHVANTYKLPPTFLVKTPEQYYALTAKLRDYGNDYAMENGGLTSALYLAADIIELLLP
jgi:hypothetical protein